MLGSVLSLSAVPPQAGEAAGPSAEAAALREQLEEQQQEFNDLLACLGQESAKVRRLKP